MGRHRWSDQEKEALLHYIGDYKLEDLVPLYNQWARRHGFPKRTRYAIISLLGKMKISYVPKYENLTKYQWTKLLGISNERVSLAERKGIIKVRRIKGRTVIHSREFIQAADVYPSLFAGAKIDALIYLFGSERAEELAKVKPHRAAIRVKHIPTGKIYPSLTQAGKAHHLHYSSLWKEREGIRKPSGRWEFLD